MAIISTNEHSSTNVSDWFIEIQQPKENISLPERVDCYILVNIDPKCCGDLARELNAILPLRSSSASDDKSNTDESFGDAQHQVPVTDQLKRIRRRPATIGELELVTQQNNRNLPVEARSDEAPTKRAKKNNQHNQSKSGPSSRTWSLDILVGSVEATERLLQRKKNTAKHDINSDNKPLTLESILSKYNMTTNLLVRRSLPGRPAETKEELQLWNTTLWPTLFFEKKTTQFKEEELQLSNEEKVIMITGMEAAVQDAHLGIQQWKTYFPNSDFMKSCDISGVVVMDPQNGSVVSRASDERQLQADQWQSFPDKTNPICTSTILAIQGVSRIERESAIGHGIESKEFQRGQYLCTGYDVYLTKEPTAFEAMALVHSRVRRVVFGKTDQAMGGLGGVASSIDGLKGGIHCLPGTNHHYRAFRLNLNTLKATTSDDTHDQSVKKLIQSLKDL